MQYRLFKNPNFPSLLRIGKNLEIYSTRDQHLKIQMLKQWMSWENLCPNLSFTGGNKMGNLYKKGWSHVKLNINEFLNFMVMQRRKPENEGTLFREH